MKSKKRLAGKSRSVDLELLRESLKISKKLARAGLTGRSYSLPYPYKNRMVKTTPAELLSLQEELAD